MNNQAWLDDVVRVYARYKKMCEHAVGPVSDDDFFKNFGPQSLAMQVKHIGGNMRSRWQNFLTSDGEKIDRNRDQEFLVSDNSRDEVMAVWENGWSISFEEWEQLTGDDLNKSITIRGEPMKVYEAFNRNLTHVAYHTGQIVTLARGWLGEDWSYLSIPPGQSQQANQKMQEKFGNWWEKENQSRAHN